MYRLLRLVALVAVLIGSLAVPSAGSVAAQETSCADYSSAAAAQFALEINPGLAGALDPDGNGTACDHEGTGANPTPSSTTLQLPTDTAVTPTPSGQQPQGTVDVIDQQPTTTTTTTQQTGNNALAGRVGDNQASFATVHGAPIEDVPSDTNPSISLRAYTPPATAFDFYTVDWNDQVAILVVVAETSWSGTEAAGIMDDYLPSDVTSLPEPEVLSDGSLLMPVFSNELSAGVTADMMSQAGIPGVPGDMYVLLFTDGTDRVVEIEIGLGNGDDVRSDSASGTTDPVATVPPVTPTTAPVPPTSTPATTTSTTDATTFLQETRVEVDQLQGQIAELRAIISAGTFTEAESQRLSEIIVGWMAIDTSLPSAPPEHSGIATQLQQVRGDMATVGSTLFIAISSGDTAGIQSAADLLITVESNLTSLDQQLTALGF
ncbi:MAG TPA: hypothetical protein VD789_07205 [Thermomicrobiales bacterium]|nr:hypothetical protein [Thermomicrobiales bacterium]